MRKLLFASAVVLLGTGAAFADSAPSSSIVNPDHVIMETYAQARTTGDTYQPSTIVHQPRFDYSSAAAIRAPSAYPSNFNARGGDAAPPLH